MDAETIERLCRLNTSFYARNATSFASTRNNSWPGWERLAGLLQAEWALPSGADTHDESLPPRTVLDVACGNLRFESFLADRLDRMGPLTFHAVDDCAALLPGGFTEGGTIRYHDMDIASALLSGDDLAQRFASQGIPACSVAVSFGFLHHLPTQALRIRVLQALLASVEPGGLVAVSLWRFLNSPELARKAQVSDAAGRALLDLPALEPGDYLLGWREETDSFRYCHSFSKADIDQLAHEAGGTPVARFDADGRTGNLNTYLVMRRGA